MYGAIQADKGQAITGEINRQETQQARATEATERVCVRGTTEK